VPPGSSEQLPASTGVPQCPPLHTSGEQHWLELLQLEPCGRQPPGPQVFCVHWLLQHSPALLQGKPSTVQVELRHRFWSHSPLQHSSPPVQNEPFDKQVSSAHCPDSGSQKALQHSQLALQAKPSGRQPAPQVIQNGSQYRVQHSSCWLHG